MPKSQGLWPLLHRYGILKHFLCTVFHFGVREPPKLKVFINEQKILVVRMGGSSLSAPLPLKLDTALARYIER
jgi:hypothetical protein